VLELAGVKDVLGKSLGGPSKINVAKATMLALSNLRKSEETGVPPAADVSAGEAQKKKADETK
jgi:ribosomal protein S5